MSNPTHTNSAWSRVKISSLIKVLLSLMVLAGIFFTSVFIYLKSEIQSIANLTQQATPIQAQQFDGLLFSLNFFIVAVLITMTMFLILMFATLVGKIARPLEKMQNGIQNITQTNDFSIRLPVEHNDEMGAVISAFNQLNHNLKSVFDQTNLRMEQVAKGDYSQRIDIQTKGDLNRFKQHVNEAIDSLATTMTALKTIAQAIHQGQFSQRMDQNIEGGIRQDINQAMQTLDEVVKQMNRVMSGVSECELDARIRIEADGQLNQLIQHTNQAMDSLNHGLSGIFGAINGLADHDLTYQIQGQFSGELEKLKNHLNQAVQQLHQAILGVKTSADNMAGTIQQINEVNQSLSQRSQQQAQAVEHTVKTMSQLTQSIQQVADHARQANQVSMQARHETESGRQILADSVTTMQQIQESSVKINDIVGLIDSIAFQTNLLALNAAVEAARAGEHGRGFAVVAGEVRGLAQKSADASNDIRKLVATVVQDVNLGAQKLQLTQQSFEQIFVRIQQVNDFSSEMAVSANQQAKALLNINQRMIDLDEAIHHNSEMVQESNQLALELRELEENLRDEANRFKTHHRALPKI
jgi:methyl-accepting chemotaxis protein